MSVPSSLAFYLVNINVTNLDRSVRFYESLGFTQVTAFELTDPANAKLFKVQRFSRLRAAWMRLPDAAPGTPTLDLVEFIDPPTLGKVPDDLIHRGPCRLAFRVAEEELPAWQMRLEELQVEFVARYDPDIRGPLGERLPLIYFRDPDGTYLELLAMPKR
jgi:catechol 2,3-dioxygenase-like lactoylglutathione lyase family enzyme